ncbi:SCO3933 family regulatory protein [Streptomyces virginiae]|uniref:SCO3933 family regulatory protein n=1 Tax=Streptomyces virginiae TaxID=1961 RepID=UPI0030E114AD
MAMTRIRVGFLKATKIMTGTPPVPKWTDQENGIRATDRETGSPLFTVTLFLMEDDRAEALKITVPATGLPNGLHPGKFVQPVELFATPWARIFNGNLSEGVAYRCTALEIVDAPVAPDEIAAPAAAEEIAA